MSEEDHHEGWISLNGIAARVISGVLGVSALATLAFGAWIATMIVSIDRSVDILDRKQNEQSRFIQYQLSQLDYRTQRLEDRWPGWKQTERKKSYE